VALPVDRLGHLLADAENRAAEMLDMQNNA
jgi:hypothetical protein